MPTSKFLKAIEAIENGAPEVIKLAKDHGEALISVENQYWFVKAVVRTLENAKKAS